MDQKMKAQFSIIILMVLVLAYCVHGQRSTYACWGGCYNSCFIKSAQTQSESLACDYLCLKSCIPHSAADFNYYCQIGCSLKLCIPVSYDGAKLESCFGKCTNLCKKTQLP